MVLRTYNTSKDFTDAHDNYDLWVFDEFPVVEDSNMSSGFGQSPTSSANNNLLRILDGKECRLDPKYGHVFTKRNNIPIVWISNNPVLREKSPFCERFTPLKFENKIPLLRSDRLIAALWRCISHCS